MDDGKEKEGIIIRPASPSDEHTRSSNGFRHHHTPLAYALTVLIPILLLFLNFFLAQYDKFVLSYFQADVIRGLDLSPANYGILSGYATGIVYALLAIPVAFVADYTNARVWTLTLVTLWWSLCVVFQGLSHNFWQILLARIGMGIGQAPVEALSVSLISDLIEPKWMFFAESILYVGVYVGEAVSAQLATAFTKTNTPWSTAMKAIGIVGLVIGVLIRIFLREPARRAALIAYHDPAPEEVFPRAQKSRLALAQAHLSVAFGHVLRMHSFWLLTLSSGARQLSGNVFGYYMPTYLSSIYPSQTNVLSNYGIIVGVVGSVAVLSGGLISSYWAKSTASVPLLLTAIGGMISSVFVVLMILSKEVAGGNQSKGTHVLYGTMSAAYITAELWLGAFASLLVLLFPPRMKTFAYAIYISIITLIYSSGPEVIGLALRELDPSSSPYLERIKLILVIMIPLGYWIAGVGFLICIGKVRKDLALGVTGLGPMSSARKLGFGAFAFVLGGLVLGLFIASLVYKV